MAAYDAVHIDTQIQAIAAKEEAIQLLVPHLADAHPRQHSALHRVLVVAPNSLQSGDSAR